MKYLYSVAKNGIVPVRKYEVIKETPKTYVIKGGISERVLKSTMSNKYCVFFEDEKSAQLFYERVKYKPKKTKRPKKPKKPFTNFDRIKAMSVEEMAKLLCDCSDCGNGRCYGDDLCTQGDGACNGLVKWLESEVQGE